MKQTQTKLFDFSDTGLDFCVGSKNLFPDRFKKMLALGYNVQTVTSVAVSGNQVTFTYGGAHGYRADRVLKIDSGTLASINGGEFWIDSVTINTLTFTLDSAPGSVSGGFATRVAPLGWSLEYENENIHIYKLKALDESDLFIRLCFQNNLSYRNRIAPCVGKTADLTAGTITDEYALNETKAIATPGLFAWEFAREADSTFNNYTAAQGSGFGKAYIVGSVYHLALFANTTVDTAYSACGLVNALLPFHGLNYDAIKLPALMGQTYSVATGEGRIRTLDNAAMYVGNISTRIQASPAGGTGDSIVSHIPFARSSFLPVEIDSFNTTTCWPIPIYQKPTCQFLGYVYGIFLASYAASGAPGTAKTNIPLITKDIDLNSNVVVHQIEWNSLGGGVWFAAPIEEVKIGA